MSQDSTLANALADVRRQRAALEADFERVGAELTKLRLAERSLPPSSKGRPWRTSPTSSPVAVHRLATIKLAAGRVQGAGPAPSCELGQGPVEGAPQGGRAAGAIPRSDQRSAA